MPAERRRGRLALGLGLNAALVAVPGLFAAPPLLPFAALLGLASAACAVDLWHCGGDGQPLWRVRAVDRRSGWLDGLLGAALLVTFWVAAGAAGPCSEPALGVGIVLMAGGSGLRWAAHRALGPQFRSGAVVVAGDALVTRGVFSFLRHPSDAGIVLLATGAAVLTSSPWAALVALGAVAPLAVARARLDDQVLDRAFGERHRRYRRRVHAILPAPILRLVGPLLCAALLLAGCDEPPKYGCETDADCDAARGEACDDAENECQIPCMIDSDCGGLICCPIGDVPNCEECTTGADCFGGPGCLQPGRECEVGSEKSAVTERCHLTCSGTADCYASAGICASDGLCYGVDSFAACDRVADLRGPAPGGPLIFDPRQDPIGADGASCTKAPEFCLDNGNVCQFSFQFYDPDGDVPTGHDRLYRRLFLVAPDGTRRAAYDVVEASGGRAAVQDCFPETLTAVSAAVVLSDEAGNESNPLCFDGSAR